MNHLYKNNYRTQKKDSGFKFSCRLFSAMVLPDQWHLYLLIY